MPPQFISLIHGVRRVNRITPDRRWMGKLGDYLNRAGFADVAYFSWNGGLLRGLRAADAPAYSRELLRSYQRARAVGGTVSIVAKSLGGLIAERALGLMESKVRVDLFLRIAVPDSRTVLRLPNVSRVVNVTSTSDYLFRIGRHFTPLFFHHDSHAPVTKSREIVLTRLTHSALTERTPLTGDALRDATTYDLYGRLLAPSVEITEGV